ncbi:glycerol kinase [Limosa lapponica baueri]|uniref:Glycerol kinase n=1 Tax=Limosa lapponica baueri TaxID=1758121 RepID=A0A2I0TIP7_LIMLA|nr:glycerol kinase [Limosa lapponica baueri]
MLLERYDIVAITETWWEESYDWSVAIDGYKLFRRHRQRRRGGHVALHVKEWIEYEEMSLNLSLGADEERVQSLWVVEEPTRRGVLLDLVLTNKEGLVEGIKVGGSLGCSDHEKIEFRFVGSMRKTSRTATLDFRRANFDLFKKLLGEIPWDRCIPKRKKSGKGSRRPAWLSRELLQKLKWKNGLTTWEDYKNVIRVCRDERRKAKASLELKLARDVKVKKKGFVKCIGGKRKTRENVGLLLKEMGAMVTEDAEKVELLNAFSASVFNAQASPQESQTLEETEKVWTKEDFPLVEEDQIREQLSKLDIHKSMGPDGMHS